MNNTSFDYKIEICETGKAAHIKTGQAHKSHFFFYGAEVDVDRKIEESLLLLNSVNSKTTTAPHTFE